MSDSSKPSIGDLAVDATSIASFIIDLPPGEMQGMRCEKPGFTEVEAEILAHQALWGDKAGITQGDFAEFKTTSERIAKIDVFLGAANKLVELLTETRAFLIDRRERLINAFARSVDTRANTFGAEILAKYEKTRAYRSLIANKAVKTREKNAKAANATKPEPAPTKPEPAPTKPEPAPAPKPTASQES